MEPAEIGEGTIYYIWSSPPVVSKSIKSATNKAFFFKTIWWSHNRQGPLNVNIVVAILILKDMTSLLLTFAVPHTQVFYFFAQREGHHLVASILISWCEEHFICLVLWQLYCLSGRSFHAHLSPCSIGSFWTQYDSVYQKIGVTPCQTCALYKSHMKLNPYI